MNKTAKRVEHTPGPWRARTDHKGITEITGNSQYIVEPCRMDQANASLIASAPELLEACQQFMRYARNGNHTYLKTYADTIAGSKMKQAINKAQGQKEKNG